MIILRKLGIYINHHLRSLSIPQHKPLNLKILQTADPILHSNSNYVIHDQMKESVRVKMMKGPGHGRYKDLIPTIQALFTVIICHYFRPLPPPPPLKENRLARIHQMARMSLLTLDINLLQFLHHHCHHRRCSIGENAWKLLPVLNKHRIL